MICPKLETKDRIKRAKAEGKTRLIKQLDTTETYEGFETQFGRYKDVTGNPQIAFKLMLDVLGAPSDEQIKKAAEEGQ